jgi:hemoglobin
MTGRIFSMLRIHALLASGIIATGLLAGATSAQTPSVVFPTVSNPQVLADFGGVAGIRALMEDFERNLIANPTTRPFFANRDNTMLKARLTEQVCQILGGGCVYTGATMADSHRNMGVNQAHFLQLVDALQVSMNARGIPFRSQNQLLVVLAPMNRDIITR